MNIHRDSIVKYVFLLLLIFGVDSRAERPPLPEETVPPYHWMHDVAIRLADAGVLDLNLTYQPFTRGRIAKAVLEAEERNRAEPRYAKGLLDRLSNELSPEIEALKSDKALLHRISKAAGDLIGDSDSKEPWTLHIGEYVTGDILAGKNSDSGTEGFAISKIGVRLWEGSYTYFGIRADSYLADDTSYSGTVWRGVTGYTEQAYTTFRHRRISGWIGRNWLRWGPGRNGCLVISDASRPFTGLHVSVDLAPLTYRWAALELDRIHSMNRYLAVHRLEWRALENLRLEFSEMVLYGGLNRGWELRLMNPAAPWQAEMYSPGTSGNGLFSFDILWKPVPSLTVSLEFLIDDYQLDKNEPADLEPNELGGLATVIWADPLGIYGSRWTLEAATVTPRTYNTPEPVERVLHYDKPVGWHGGNDLIQWYGRWDHIPEARTVVGVDIALLRKGEDMIEAPFNTTFLQYSVEQGYEEPYPTGIVENTLAIGADVSFQPKPWVWGELRGEIIRYENEGHIRGVDNDDWNVRLRIVFNLDYVAGMKVPSVR